MRLHYSCDQQRVIKRRHENDPLSGGPLPPPPEKQRSWPTKKTRRSSPRKKRSSSVQRYGSAKARPLPVQNQPRWRGLVYAFLVAIAVIVILGISTAFAGAISCGAYWPLLHCDGENLSWESQPHIGPVAVKNALERYLRVVEPGLIEEQEGASQHDSPRCTKEAALEQLGEQPSASREQKQFAERHPGLIVTHDSITERVAEVEGIVEHMRLTQWVIASTVGVLGLGLIYCSRGLRQSRGLGAPASRKPCSQECKTSLASLTPLVRRRKIPAGSVVSTMEEKSGNTPSKGSIESGCMAIPTALVLSLASDPLKESDEQAAIPEPAEALKRLLDSMKGASTLRHVCEANAPWETGVARHIGPVRKNQEDYTLSFRVGDVLVSLLADGAGGHPLGEMASYLGVMGAAASLVDFLSDWPEESSLRRCLE